MGYSSLTAFTKNFLDIGYLGGHDRVRYANTWIQNSRFAGEFLRLSFRRNLVCM